MINSSLHQNNNHFLTMYQNDVQANRYNANDASMLQKLQQLQQLTSQIAQDVRPRDNNLNQMFQADIDAGRYSANNAEMRMKLEQLQALSKTDIDVQSTSSQSVQIKLNANHTSLDAMFQADINAGRYSANNAEMQAKLCQLLAFSTQPAVPSLLKGPADHMLEALIQSTAQYSTPQPKMSDAIGIRITDALGSWENSTRQGFVAEPLFRG